VKCKRWQAQGFHMLIYQLFGGQAGSHAQWKIKFPNSRNFKENYAKEAYFAEKKVKCIIKPINSFFYLFIADGAVV